MINQFTFASSIYELRPLRTIRLPDFPGSTFRGGFGHVFKKVVCAFKDVECDQCSIRHTCVYSYVFETPPGSDTEIMRKYDRAPHPFVIEPIADGKTLYDVNDVLRLRVILIGNASSYYPYFIYAFRELGKIGIGKERGHYVLDSVYSENSTGKKKKIYHQDSKELTSPYRDITLEAMIKDIDTDTGTVRCRFVTPTRLQYEGEISSRLDFHILIRNLLRRISLLAYFHCGMKLDVDFAGLIERAKKVETIQHRTERYDWTRWSNRQQRRMTLPGQVGSVTYTGELREFMPFLVLGQYTHVGKNATFGLGKYEIEIQYKKDNIL